MSILRNTLSLGFSLLLSLLFTLSAWGQELPPAQLRAWQNPENGRLYWNRHMPAYLHMSPGPTTDSAYALQSQSMPQWAAPFYLDTEGINYIRTRWAVDTTTRQTISPRQEILWEVYADGIAPVTHIRLEGAIRLGKGEWMLGPAVKIELNATDATSGVDKIYYALDSSGFHLYEEPITVTQEGRLNLRFCAEDRVGNREALQSVGLVTDCTPPSSRCIVTGVHLGRDNTVAASSKLHIEASDGESGLHATYYRIDSGEWKRYAPHSTISLRNIPDGRHTLSFYSVDKVNNQEPIQMFDFYLDATAPITISDILGDKFLVGDKMYFSGRTKMKITAVDNHAGVKEVLYSVDGGEFKLYEEPFYMPNVPGWHVVKYFSIDSTENRTEGVHNEEFYEFRMKVDKIYVDLTGPTISHSLAGDSFARNDTIFVAPTTKITLKGEDHESGLNRLTYSLDNDPWEKEYEAPFDLQGLSSGEHSVEYFGYDNVGNRNVSNFRFILDSDPPEVSFSLSVSPYPSADSARADSLATYPRDAKVFLTAQDNMTGVRRLQYSLNGKPMTDYTKPFGGLERGRNRLVLRATDMVGNTKEVIRFFDVR